MNGFAQAKEIERVAMQELMPWLTHKFSPIELCENEFLQKTLGDFTIQQQLNRRSVELKAEQKFTGNLFLEVWSNRPARTLGWLFTSRADLLAYYFCDNRQLFVFSLPKLQDWAFGIGSAQGAIYAYPEKVQTRYNQLNYSFGRCVPIKTLDDAKVPMRIFGPGDRTQ